MAPPLPASGPSNESLCEAFREPNVLERYSQNHELLFSSISSFVIHLLLILIIPLLATWIAERDPTAPAVTVVQVANDTSSDNGGDGLPTGDELEQDSAASDVPLPEQVNKADVQDVKRPELETNVEKTQEQLQQDILAEQGAAARTAQAAADSLARLKDKLNSNLGDKGGGGGTGGEGRPGRAARWVLHFNTRSTRDYLAQFDGLRAEIAFPERGDQWKYYSNLTASQPTAQVRDLSREERIYWIDEDGQAIRGVCQALHVSPIPPHMIAFLPLDLEDKMLKLELAFKSAKSEDDIQQTQFKVVSRGGGYDVIVISQRLKGE